MLTIREDKVGSEAKASASRKARFLAEHPTCCYCRFAAAVEVDHCPARIFFSGRVAPLGYEFPACHNCNQSVRNVEQVVACFAAMRLEDGLKDGQLPKLFKHAINNVPGLADELRATFAPRPYIRTQTGLLLPSSMRNDAIVVGRTGPIVSHCIDIVGNKLTLALYYKHVSQLLDGFVFCRMTPTITDGEMLDAASANMLSSGPIQRNRVDLSGQFRYEYALGVANGFFAAAIRLGDQLAYLTFAIPSAMWESFRRDHPGRASEIAKFGRPDIFRA